MIDSVKLKEELNNFSVTYPNLAKALLKIFEDVKN